jgi:putative two-component system response regulator
MLTSHDQLAEKVTAADLGADDYLLKPFHVPELAARVRSLAALKRFTDDLENAAHVLAGVAQCIEARDRYTGDHCRRIAEYAVRIGRDLRLGDEDLRLLRLGGYLHDLGKVAVSDVILNKAMKSHPVVGAGLVKDMRTLEGVVPLIRHHHEKLDGSGYPDGLAGNDIGLLVRITSVADVFDALRTRRSYKDSLPADKCLQILREEAGKGWWDRDVVESLARLEGAAQT